MKRIIVIIFAILLSAQLLGQVYKTVEIEKKNIDADNKIYRPGQQFIYHLTILNGIDTLFLKMTEDRSFELLSRKTDETVSKVYLTVAQPKNKEKTNKKQTEIFYTYENLNYWASSTGIVENERNIWLHPPRDGFFRILQLFPFPYIKFEGQMHHQWTDHLAISEQWSNELIGEWHGVLETDLSYEWVENVNLKSSFGQVWCQKLKCISKSLLGENSLIAYFSKKHGFIKLEYSSFNNIRLHLDLETIKEVGVYTHLEAFLLDGK
jgi:hypothetical protein